MVNKKIVVIITIIAILVVGGIVGFKIYLLNNTEYSGEDESSQNKTYKNNIVNDNKVANNDIKEENNVIENTVVEDNNNTINETENTSKTNTESNNSVSKDSTNNTSSSNNSSVTTKKPDEEKAKDLAKKQFGENRNDVYYYVEEKVSNRVYIISVRDKSTTADLMEYEVDLDKGTATEY